MLLAIKRKFQECHFNNEPPSINKVLKVVNDDKDLPSFSRSTFYNIMKKLNLSYPLQDHLKQKTRKGRQKINKTNSPIHVARSNSVSLANKKNNEKLCTLETRKE